MAKQIIVTQGNKGIVLETSFIDELKHPVNLTGQTVEVIIVDELDVVIDTIQANIITPSTGVCYITLQEVHTGDTGLYKTYWTALDESGYITAQEELFYYVREKNGGASGTNLPLPLDVDSLITRVEEIEEVLEILSDSTTVTNVLNEVVEINGKVDDFEETLNTNINNFNTQLTEVSANVKKFGAKGDGSTDDTQAIKDAIASLPNGGEVWFPYGNYITSDIITVTSNISLKCAKGTTITKGNDLLQAFICNSNTSIVGFKFVSTSTTRGQATNNNAIVLNGDNILIAHNTIQGSKGVGIYAGATTNSSILNNIVKDTLADGIHITNISSNIKVEGNTCINTGDDSIAIVSYTTNGDYCKDIFISFNNIKNGNARGIAYVGGERVVITENIINGTSSSGIIVLQDNSYGTYVPKETFIKNNVITNAGNYGTRKGNQYGIEIHSASIGCIIEGNKVSYSYSRGLQIAGAKNIVKNNHVFNNASSNQVDSQVGIIIEGNRFEENALYGLYIVSNSDAIIKGNVFINNNTTSTAGIDNMHMSVCSNCTVVGNISVDNRTTKLVDRAYEVSSSTNIIFKSNVIDATGKIAAFTGSCTGIDRDDVISTGDPNGVVVYAIGQKYFSTDTNKLYVHIGSGVWKYTLLT